MTDFRSLVIKNGTTQNISNLDTLIVGTKVDAAAGQALSIGDVNATGITIGRAGLPLLTTSFPGPVELLGDVTTVGGTTFTSDATFEGNVTFGNGPADTVTFAASTTVVSNIAFGGAPGTYKITNLANGTAANDAVNKSQLDALVVGVSSFQTSLSGLTPSSSTGGAITLAGTLGVASGGTGATSLTSGSLLAGNGAGTVAEIAPGSNGQVLTVVGGAWAAAAPAAGGTAQGGANAIQYANATTPADFDGNANFVYDEATGRLGVGTASPSTTLHVNSGAVNGTAIATLQNTAGDFQVFRVDANPEGSVTGSIGDIADDSTNGVVYVKTSGSATNTGWSPLANLGTKVYLVVEGGQYATIQAAIDATPTGTNIVPAYSVILVGPKANTGGGASGSWGPAVLAANKSLMITGLGGAQTAKDIRIDSLTLASSAAGLNANLNENYISGLYITSAVGAATTIAVASNGQVLPQATINVASTTGFSASGTLHVATTAGLQIVTYTGTTATSFTGCSGGTGTLATGNSVSLASSVVTYSGTGAIRLRLNNCYVVNTGAGDAVTNTNSNVSGSLYLDTCIVSAESTTGIAVKTSGYTLIRNRSEVSTSTGGTSVSTGRSLFAPAGVVEIYDSFIGGASVPRPIVELTGTAFLASGYTTISNTSNDANARCVFVNSATATFGSGDATLALGSSVAVVGQVVSGTGTFAFGNITFSYSPLLTVATQTPVLRTGGWFTTDIREGISLTSPGSPLFNLNSSGRITRYNDAVPTNGQLLIGNGQATTIAVASNGQVLPQATINVASTTNFPASGTINVVTTTGTQTVTYTGTSATTFTGCSGGTGTMSTGGAVTNANSRFDAATITAGTGISVTNGAGSVTIAATGAASASDVQVTLDTTTNSVAAGDACYASANPGVVNEANADGVVVNTARALGISVGATANKVSVAGLITCNFDTSLSPVLAVGQPVYLSTTSAGKLTNAWPVTPGLVNAEVGIVTAVTTPAGGALAAQVLWQPKPIIVL